MSYEFSKFFGFFKKYAVSDPLRHTPTEVAPWVGYAILQIEATTS